MFEERERGSKKKIDIKNLRLDGRRERQNLETKKKSLLMALEHKRNSLKQVNARIRTLERINEDIKVRQVNEFLK